MRENITAAAQIYASANGPWTVRENILLEKSASVIRKELSVWMPYTQYYRIRFRNSGTEWTGINYFVPLSHS